MKLEDLDMADDDVQRDVMQALAEMNRPVPPVNIIRHWDGNGGIRQVNCAICSKRLTAAQASYGCPNGCTCVTMPAPPCCDCGTWTDERSACSLCGKVYCQRCAEKPYEFCC